MNAKPIDDVWQALDLLVKRWADSSTREIVRCGDDGPYIEIGYHYDFSDSTWYRFSVTDRLAQELLSESLVVGTPHWGFTDMNVLRASASADVRFYERRAELGLQHGDCVTTLEWHQRWRYTHALSRRRRA